MARWRLSVLGTVQGVGFRPHALRVARALGVVGSVKNSGGTVWLEAQAPESVLRQFVEALVALPAPARVSRVERLELSEDPRLRGFEIIESEVAEPLPALPADLAPCPECLAEVDARGRRGGYAFTACTRCGARYSIVERLPYDRAGTSLAAFPLCVACQREHDSPDDRRFHAQAMACPECGPTLSLLDGGGGALGQGAHVLELAAARLREGAILALKGVGGFQLLVDALEQQAVLRLRERKRREEKPFAVLLRDLQQAEEHADLSDAERQLLASPEAPIVLVQRRAEASPAIAAAVAPDNPQLGCLLPASPLHYLLARSFARPLVCTSGNLSGEPLCVETAEALERLSGIADIFLVHDRAIARPLDDSVARVGTHGATLLRRARGYAPRAVATLPAERTVLALGAELKAAPSLLVGGALVLGQHVGDLGEARSLQVFRENVADLLKFFRVEPELIACDLHPDYSSTHYAETLAAEWGVPLVRVQHHHAHVAGVVAEHGVSGPVLGVAWDGTGFGSDGTIWGGELLLVDGARSERVGCLPRFRLPGGDRASREPWRSALGLLYAVDPRLARNHGAAFLSARELEVVLHSLERGLNAPLTTSAGRLFDAVAALAGFHRRIGFEGQAAMQLEFAARAYPDGSPYPLELEVPSGPEPLMPARFVEALLSDVRQGATTGQIAARFHASLVAAAARAATRLGVEHVVLSGGCFQNRRLSEGLTQALTAAGHRVLLAGQIPCNDGGISAGQAAVAAFRS